MHVTLERRLVWALLIAAGTALLLTTADRGRTYAQEMAECPPNAVVRVSPPEGETSSVVSVEVSPDMTISPAADGDEDSFHLHYFINTDPSDLAPGDVIPAGNPNIIHSADTELDLQLPSGEHQVWVVLGQLGHQACGTSDGNLVVGSTQFTIPAGAGANEQAVTEDDDSGTNVLVIVLVLVAVLAIAAAAAYYMGLFGPRRRRQI